MSKITKRSLFYQLFVDEDANYQIVFPIERSKDYLGIWGRHRPEQSKTRLVVGYNFFHPAMWTRYFEAVSFKKLNEYFYNTDEAFRDVISKVFSKI